jgi:hypothetical protein
VTTAKIAASAVTDAKIADVAAGKITGTIAAARLPLSTTAQALTGTDTATALTPAAMHLSRRGSGRAKFWELFNDFTMTNASATQVGSDGCIFNQDASGAGADLNISANDPSNFSGRMAAGLLSLRTGTATNGRAGYGSYNTTSTHRFDTGTTTFETLVYLPTLADATNDYVFRIGYCQGNALSNDMMCFQYDRSTSANWFGLSRQNTAQSTADTGVAVVAEKWVLLRVVFTSSLATFSVNNGTGATLSTNIKANGVTQFGAHILKTAGTTSRTAIIDYVYYRHDFDSDRTFTP